MVGTLWSAMPLFALAALLVLPAAQADLAVTVELPGVLLSDTAGGTANVTVSLDCQTVLSQPTGLEPVRLLVTAPAGVMLQGPASLGLDAAACQADPMGNAAATARFNVTVGAETPGLEPLPVTVEARHETTGAAARAQTASATGHVTADFMPRISVSVPATIQEGAPGKEIAYEMEVTNLGNARTVVTFGFAGLPEGWQGQTPEPVVLEAAHRQGGQTQATARVIVVASSDGAWTNKESALQVTLTPAAQEDPEKTGDEVRVNLLARARGAPAPGAVWIGVMLLAALARRRPTATGLP